MPLETPSARSIVAVMLTVTICAAILAPVFGKIFGLVEGPLPEAVIASLADLLKVAIGAVVGWLSASPGKE